MRSDEGISRPQGATRSCEWTGKPFLFTYALAGISGRPLERVAKSRHEATTLDGRSQYP